MCLRVLQFLAGPLILISVSLAASTGPESGGGGNVVRLGADIPVLMDYFNLPSAVVSLARLDANIDRSTITALSPLTFGEHGILSNDPAFKLASGIFAQWAALPFDSISVRFDGAMGPPLQWLFTDGHLSPSSHFRPTGLPAHSRAETAAYYTASSTSYLVRISLPIWRQLSITSQAGLLVHETLRQMQLGQSFGFDDETLQKATAIMMMCKPTIKLDQYLLMLINNRLDLATARYGAFEHVTHNCGER